MELWIATGNKGKLNEFKMLLDSVPVEIHAISEMPVYSPPPENGKTFLDNARIKAKSLKALKREAWVLADDSGLECEGIGNLPGIHSARYAGEKALDAENTAKLLKMLQVRTNNRNAAFKCVLVAIAPDGSEHIFEGTLKGTIAFKQSGTAGFGYDPVFIPEGYDKTLAELPPSEKNKISHRAKAVASFRDLLKSSL
jgi:XTP/dITP diphosphohydrolase